MRVYAVLYALSWLPWLLHAQWPLPATLAWFALMGLLIPGFTLTWTVAKEVNRPEHSGIATSVVNVGIFLGTGILQPLVGAVLDRGRAAGDLAGAWDTRHRCCSRAAAAFGAAMTFFVRESHDRDGPATRIRTARRPCPRRRRRSSPPTAPSAARASS